MTDQLIRAAGYIRVSTEEQRKHGWNLGADRERIERTVAERGWKLTAIYDDGGKQGDDPTRPGFLRMLAEVDDFDVLILRAVDRFSRRLAIYASAVDDLIEAGVTLYEFEGDGTGLKKLDLTDEDRALADIKAVFAQLEKAKTKRRVRQAVRARAAAGLATGAYGYARHDKQLVPVPAEAAIVRRIFDDWINGVTQRTIHRALNAANVPPARSGQWTQGMISRVLANPLYKGWFRFNGEVLKGTHEPIVSEAVWDQAQQVRQMSVRQTGGQWAHGAHLLVKGTLRCGRCGSAMIPRKGRPGGGRDRYECRRRVEHGPHPTTGGCDQPSIRRELVDGPLLANLTDYYIDWEASKRRIEERGAQDLVMAREAARQDDAEVQRSEARIARIQRGWQDGVLDDADYRGQHDQVSGELEAAQAARERSHAHVERIEQTGVSSGAEQQLLEHMNAIKRAVADGVSRAPNLNALRNVIGQLFESVELVEWQWTTDSHDTDEPRWTDPERRKFADFREAWEKLPTPRPNPVLDANGGATYVLVPRLRSTPSPTGHLTPVGSIEQYPPSDANPFLARYCWWYSSA